MIDASTDYAIAHNLTPLVSIQNDHSPMCRKEEREMFPTLMMYGVGSIPWSPLARGLSRPNAASSKRGDTDPLAQAGMVYGITPHISGFAFPAAEEFVGHYVLASHRASVDIRGSAKTTPLCAMRVPDLELARRWQDQYTLHSSELRAWTAHGPLEYANHDHKYTLLTHDARYTGIQAPPPTLASFKRIFDIVAGTKLRLPASLIWLSTMRTTLYSERHWWAMLLGRRRYWAEHSRHSFSPYSLWQQRAGAVLGTRVDLSSCATASAIAFGARVQGTDAPHIPPETRTHV
ncbi:hypothetical protein VTO73DRAFT_2381 [Trametes versicolor]